jgi:hypothetical protein
MRLYGRTAGVNHNSLKRLGVGCWEIAQYMGPKTLIGLGFSPIVKKICMQYHHQ